MCARVFYLLLAAGYLDAHADRYRTTWHVSAVDLYSVADGFPRLRQTSRIDPGSDTSWYLVADPELCGHRRPGLRTMLVGPGPATRRATIQRCDMQTRDLHAAAIEILAREAMAPVG